MATATANTAAASVCSSRLHGANERNRRPPPSSSSTGSSRQSFDSGGDNKSLSPRRSPLSIRSNSSSPHYLRGNNLPSVSSRGSPSSMTLAVPTLAFGSRDSGGAAAGGAIPKSTGSSTGNSSSSGGTPSSGEAKRCFCGHFQENNNNNSNKKPGRCKFCRCKAKYVPGQRSFDATRLFGRRDRAITRRAISEDRRNSGTDEEPSAASSPVRGFFNRRLKRQDRLEEPPPSSSESLMDPRDHGLRTPPAPPNSLTVRHPRGACTSVIGAHQYHLTPANRTLERAHTDPNSVSDIHHPISPPPPYDDVVKQQRARPAPPTYEEALNNQLSDIRLSSVRSLSEDRTVATSGSHAHTTSPPFRQHPGRNRPLTRTRAEDIPDIYWEQAARELDFCTCRKCQTRYRQYFEEEHDSNNIDSMMGDGMIPIETQVLMQEVLTDGMAFCSLM